MELYSLTAQRRTVPSMAKLAIRAKDGCRWDLVCLGEVMLRLEPGDGRIATAREFRVWEGGGEYNVARALTRCFGLDTALVSALADNAVGRLIEDLIRQGGVGLDHLRWTPYDGVGRAVRNGLNFVERGYGVRPPHSCSDRGHSAASQIQPGTIDWDAIFAGEGARWFHTGGIFAALAPHTPDVVLEAMQAARRAGTIVSYDANYRPSLWQSHGGVVEAGAINRRLAAHVDVMIGHEEDFAAALGMPASARMASARTATTRTATAHAAGTPARAQRMIRRFAREFPNVAVVATTLRHATSATRHDWGAIAYGAGRFHEATLRRDLEIYDRVGGGDAFAAGLIYSLLAGRDLSWGVECGAAHGALAMTTPGDTSMATLAEVLHVMVGRDAVMIR